MSVAAVIRRIEYDVTRYDFAKVLADHVIEAPLDLRRLHETMLLRKQSGGDVDPLGSEDNKLWRQKMLDMPTSSAFYELYHRFIREVVAARFYGKISYSNKPYYRVHAPNTPSVSCWHRDIQVTKRRDQITAWVPFVDTENYNTMWIESHYGENDLVPVRARYGEIVLADTGLLLHGSTANRTEHTRVSMDFRFKPLVGCSGDYGDILANRPADYLSQQYPPE